MAITTHITSTIGSSQKSSVLAVMVSSDMKLPEGLGKPVVKEIVAHMKELEFTGAWGAAELFLAPVDSGVSFIGVIGLGKVDATLELRAEAVRRGVGKLVQEARRHLVHEVQVLLPNSETVPLSAAAVEAACLADYRFFTHKKHSQVEHKARSLKSLVLVVPKEVKAEVVAVVEETKEIMAAIELVRDLVNQPASHMSPATLVQEAKKIAKGSPLLALKVMDRKAAKAAGMTAFLAVAQGSQEEPYVIHLSYKPKKPKRKIVLVGKGITFDSGGLSLKPANYMEDMKIDMAGAATVLAVLSVLPSLKLPIEVQAIVAACENMPSGNAYRPGDVLHTKNGKTIEVLNTDAEGRVTLADALAYAVEQKPDMVIDLATLTGACMVAVGETHSGLWSNREELADSLMEAAKKSGEGLVQFPLPEEYKPGIVSRVADLRNIPVSRFGDAIAAALFLQEFVGDTAWAHLDIAGPVHLDSAILPYYAPGATGYGVRTLVNFLKAQA